MLTGTRLEDDLADLLWSFVNLFHRKIDRIERELDINEQAQRRGQAEQDGSEVKSVELERLIGQGISLIERRNAFEFFRDHAAELFEAATGSAWRPRAGSMVNHRALTASMIDSREFLAARRRADTEVLAPAGTRIAFTGGTDCNDHRASGTRSTRSAPSTPTWCCCTAAARAAPSASPPAGPTIARSPRSSSSPTGPAPQRGALQAQRPDARGPADRRRRLPRLRHLRQPRRQGQEARHPGVAVHGGRRRVGAVFSSASRRTGAFTTGPFLDDGEELKLARRCSRGRIRKSRLWVEVGVADLNCSYRLHFAEPSNILCRPVGEFQPQMSGLPVIAAHLNLRSFFAILPPISWLIFAGI